MRTAEIGFVLVVSLLLSATSVRAQLFDDYGAKVGVVSASAWDPDGALDPERRTGVAVSIFGERKMPSNVSLIGEFGYVQRGFTYSVRQRNDRGIELEPVEGTARLDYLTLPVLLKLNHAMTGGTLYAAGGPRFDLLVHRKPATFDLAVGKKVEGGAVDFFDQFLVGGTIGIGVSTRTLLPLPLIAEGRYALDVTGSDFGGRSIRNNTISIMVGTIF